MPLDCLQLKEAIFLIETNSLWLSVNNNSDTAEVLRHPLGKDKNGL